MIARTENTMMLTACSFTECRKDRSSHSFRHVQFDDNRGSILVPLPTRSLEDVEVLASHGVLGLARYNPLFYLFSLRRSHEIDWSRYVGMDLPVFLCYFGRRQVYDISTLRAS